MASITNKLFSAKLILLFLASLFIASGPTISRAQKPGRAAAAGDEEPEAKPIFADFKGVRLGMSADDARRKLGTPRDQGDDQDFFVFNEKQAVQVLYDKSHMVNAISIDFMGGAEAPSPKDVVGGDIQAKPDGSLYKLVRYPKAGYWVSYSRTAGDSPLISITIQRIEK